MRLLLFSFVLPLSFFALPTQQSEEIEQLAKEKEELANRHRATVDELEDANSKLGLLQDAKLEAQQQSHVCERLLLSSYTWDPDSLSFIFLPRTACARADREAAPVRSCDQDSGTNHRGNGRKKEKERRTVDRNAREVSGFGNKCVSLILFSLLAPSSTKKRKLCSKPRSNCRRRIGALRLTSAATKPPRVHRYGAAAGCVIKSRPDLRFSCVLGRAADPKGGNPERHNDQ